MTRSRSKGRADRIARVKDRRAFVAEAALAASCGTGILPVAHGLEAHATSAPGVTVEVFPDGLKCWPALAVGEPETPPRELDVQGGRTGRSTLAPSLQPDPLSDMSPDGRRIALGVASASRIADIRRV